MAIPQIIEHEEYPISLVPCPVVLPGAEPPHRLSALIGGAKAFAEPLHVGRPNIGSRASLQTRIDGMLDRNWLTNDGPLVREFEQKVAAHLGVKHCVTTCNGTTALMLAVRGLDMKGEVIVPSFTFVATAHAMQWQEIVPVFCDIDPATHNLDPNEVERHITPRTTGIVGVHLWGRPCNVPALQEIAKRRKLKLMFDASHAFGCSYGGELIGRFGDAEVFSFHATKFLNAFEGGAVVTNNDELAKKLRLMRNFGFTGYDSVEYLGTNAKMPEVCAAMGITGMESIEQFIAVNRRNYFAYRTQLAGLAGVQLAAYDDAECNNFQYIILEIDPDECVFTRDELLAVLHAENVLARRYFHPGCHRMEPYKSYFPTAGLSLPETERMSLRVLALPTGTAIGHREIEMVASILRSAFRDAGAIKAAIAAQATPQASSIVTE
jgi:dTDP-4-amino-4,6-dideoxygalactose transaminase